MNWTTQNVIFGREWMRTVMAAFAAAPLNELIDTAKIRLSQDPAFSLTPQTLIADLTAGEADYSGYAAGGIAWTVGVPVNLGPTRVGVQAPVSFIAAAATPFVSNTVYGWWADDSTNLIVGEVFPPGTTFGFTQVGDFLQLDIVAPFALQLANLPV